MSSVTNPIDKQLTAAIIMTAPLTPQEVQINSTVDNLIMQATNRLSSKSEFQAFKAYMNSLRAETYSQIADLRRKKISEKELNKGMQDIETSLKSSANRYLANCQSYQRMKEKDETDFQAIDEKIQRKKLDLLQWPTFVGSTIGNTVGIVSRVHIIDKMAAQVEAQNAAAVKTAEKNVAAAAAKFEQLVIKSDLAKGDVAKARQQAIKGATKHNVVEINKVKAALRPVLKTVETLAAQTAAAHQARLAAEKALADTIVIAAKKTAKVVANKGWRLVGAALLGSVIGGGVGGGIGLGLELLVTSDEAH